MEQNYKTLYPHHYDGPHFDWPPYRPVEETPKQVENVTILLEYFGLPLPPDMQGRPLRDTIADDMPVRQAALFGLHGGHVTSRTGATSTAGTPA